MGSKRHRGHSAEIVDPVQVRRLVRRVESADEQVDGVRRARAQRLCQRPTYPRRSRLWTQRIEVADVVESDVSLDVLSKLDRVACSTDRSINVDESEIEIFQSLEAWMMVYGVWTNLTLQSKPLEGGG